MANRPAEGAPSPHELAALSDWLTAHRIMGCDEAQTGLRVLSALRAVERERDAAYERAAQVAESYEGRWVARPPDPEILSAALCATEIKLAIRALSPGAATTESEGTHG